ncbi:multidrug resistance protein, SMR family [Bacteriovorax sp. BAL6_X]|uniref:DMT family transporter n=1 Tax=Bacteriovorax sp. BAL6_X TaxID=1201290 RepID=UPI0003856C94|nr:SMR family transporter [Bacteriovorax sp. BAL6_X]EPZ50016.1 multidrug resistance protein, SMR family [Bacteriovorax sp. BAL6_X]
MNNSSSWIILILAGLLEICWAVGLKYSSGFTKLIPSLFTVFTLIGSMLLLAKATQVLPIGTAYGVWVGIGALGAAILGVVLFKEEITLYRFIFLALLLISIIGLKITSSPQTDVTSLEENIHV